MQLICIKINKFSLSIQIKGFPPTISIRQTSKRLLNRQIKSIGITLVNWVKVFLFNTYYFKQPKTKHCNKLTLKCWGEWLEGIPVEPSMFYLAAGCSHVLHCTVALCAWSHVYHYMTSLPLTIYATLKHSLYIHCSNRDLFFQII